MLTSELKAHLHKLIDETQNMQLLNAIYNFFIKNKVSDSDKVWGKLSSSQKKKKSDSFEGSKDDKTHLSIDTLNLNKVIDRAEEDATKNRTIEAKELKNKIKEWR
ncbi:MAG: hypothetical protein OEW75_14850 [Cyclobacteriaceae bacterium]|nr:hypothetical protein [Cyclobacteriaceae bacterium]